MKVYDVSLLRDKTLIAFDTETSGAYPLDSEIVEIGFVKWKNGEIVDQFQTLVRPDRLMSDFIIGIHGITNEMVATAPRFGEVADHVVDAFNSADYLVAHHCPFDMGFISYELERVGGRFPVSPSLCSSLIARNHLQGPLNHKLQTLIPFLGIEKGDAHRALDDARACLEVVLHCLGEIERSGGPAASAPVIQKYQFSWPAFRLNEEPFLTLQDAVKTKMTLSFIYKGEKRNATVLGIVRNPQGDFVAAICHRDNKEKRFYVERMRDLQLIE